MTLEDIKVGEDIKNIHSGLTIKIMSLGKTHLVGFIKQGGHYATTKYLVNRNLLSSYQPVEGKKH